MEKMCAIPHADGPARYTVNAFTGSAFVEMTDSGRFEIRMQYPVLGMQNAEKRCFVRTEVYDRLLKAADLLPRGYMRSMRSIPRGSSGTFTWRRKAAENRRR